ncbi:MAG: putative metal-binding motif-containing protein, partial [Deltaproteobacteria bacterium]|nr:putative metal-binding motif-containing protein [Deltaproteobacteria bacterium]
MRHALLALLMTATLGCSAMGLFDRNKLTPDDTSTDQDADPTDMTEIEDLVEVTDGVDAEDVIEEQDAVEDQPEDTPEEDADEEWECTIDDDCNDDDPCTEDVCETHTCSNAPMDADDDSYVAVEVEGTSCGGDDCNDGMGSVHPGATEICGDGIDQDCDGGEYPMVMLTSPVAVTSTTVEQAGASLAWSGSSYAMVWSENLCTVVTTPCPLYFQRLDGAGALVGSTVHFIDTYHTSLTNNAMP